MLDIFFFFLGGGGVNTGSKPTYEKKSTTPHVDMNLKRVNLLLVDIPAISFISFITVYILWIPIPIFLYHCTSF